MSQLELISMCFAAPVAIAASVYYSAWLLRAPWIVARALRHQRRLRLASLPVIARAPIRYQDDAGTHPIPIPVPDAECGYCVPDDNAGPAGLHSWWRKPCICGQDCGFEYCRKRPHATDSEISAVMGLSPYSSPYKLYHQKLGILPADDDSKAARVSDDGKPSEWCAWLWKRAGTHPGSTPRFRFTGSTKDLAMALQRHLEETGKWWKE